MLVAYDTMFRVHKSFLAWHSAVFADLFSLSQPDEVVKKTERENGNGSGSVKGREREGCESVGLVVGGVATVETELQVEVEGCPVVPLHDSPEDVASLLYALYDGP